MGLTVGDQVVVLWRGQCSFVTVGGGNGQWILKGECFVDGSMGGDKVAELIRREEKDDVAFEYV